MAINAYTGLPGSGKSYTVVERVILPALEKGKKVWTNIPMNNQMLEVMEYPGELVQFDTRDVIDNERWFQEVFPAGAILVIDECWRFWPSGMRANQMLEGHKSFFAEHRHMVSEDGFSTEIVLVTQNLSQIAATLRDLVEFTYVTIKLKAVGLDRKFRVDVYDKAVTGVKPPKNQQIRQLYGSYQEKVYRFYQSQTMSNSEGHGDETSTDATFNIWNNKTLVYGAPIFFGFMLWFIWWGASSVYDGYTGGLKTEEITQVDEVSPVSQGEKVTKPKPKRRVVTPQLTDIFDGSKFHIIYNSGIWPAVDYRIRISDADSESVVSINQLKGLGFSVRTVSQCLVILTDELQSIPVRCLPAIVNDQTESPLSSIELI